RGTRGLPQRATKVRSCQPTRSLRDHLTPPGWNHHRKCAMRRRWKRCPTRPGWRPGARTLPRRGATAPPRSTGERPRRTSSRPPIHHGEGKGCAPDRLAVVRNRFGPHDVDPGRHGTTLVVAAVPEKRSFTQDSLAVDEEPPRAAQEVVHEDADPAPARLLAESQHDRGGRQSGRPPNHARACDE